MARPGRTCRRRRLIVTASQFIIVTIMLTTEINGYGFGGIGRVTKSVARSVARVPSAVMDGSQYATHKVAGAVGSAVQPVAPLKKMVDVAGGTVSNVLGSTSRLLGKNKNAPPNVVFLYDRQLSHLGTSRNYLHAVQQMLGLALTNVVLYADEMAAQPGNVDELPVLSGVLDNLEAAGAPDEDIDRIIHVLGCNGHRDIPKDMVPKILGTLKDRERKFKSSGPIDEIRWIADHPNGFYKLPPGEATDYKMDTKYTKCTPLFPPTAVQMQYPTNRK